MSLLFAELRSANEERCKHFRNRKGEICHGEQGVDDWSPNDWMTAIAGEVGELAGVLKKVRRGDIDWDEALLKASHEMADVVIYLDLLASRLNIDLGQAVRRKFNLKSEEVGSPVRL